MLRFKEAVFLQTKNTFSRLISIESDQDNVGAVLGNNKLKEAALRKPQVGELVTYR